MTMTYTEVQPDTRVIVDSRGGIKGTVLQKLIGGKDGAEELVRIKFDDGAIAYNYPSQLSPLDEPAAAPKLSRAYKGTSTFWFGGHEYEIYNTTGLGDVRGCWACKRRGTDEWLVTRAETRKAAFETALRELRTAR